MTEFSPPPRVTPDHERPDAERHPLARTGALRAGRWGLIGLAALLVIASLLVHGHPHFALDALPGFYAWFGLGVGVAVVAFGKLWAHLFQREDGYYD